MERIDRFQVTGEGDNRQIVWAKGIFPSPAEIGRAAIMALGDNFGTELAPVTDGKSTHLVLRKRQS